MKTEFQLEIIGDGLDPKIVDASICIIGNEPDYKPYVLINTPGGEGFYIQDKDLRLFAKNLSKALTPNTQTNKTNTIK